MKESKITNNKDYFKTIKDKINPLVKLFIFIGTALSTVVSLYNNYMKSNFFRIPVKYFNDSTLVYRILIGIIPLFIFMILIFGLISKSLNLECNNNKIDMLFNILCIIIFIVIYFITIRYIVSKLTSNMIIKTGIVLLFTGIYIIAFITKHTNPIGKIYPWTSSLSLFPIILFVIIVLVESLFIPIDGNKKYETINNNLIKDNEVTIVVSEYKNNYLLKDVKKDENNKYKFKNNYYYFKNISEVEVETRYLNLENSYIE